MADIEGVRITLVSDTSPEFSTNTNSSFRVRLADPIQLKGADWEAALVSVSIPNLSSTPANFDLANNDWLVKFSHQVILPSSNYIESVTKVITCGDIFGVKGGVQSGTHLFSLISRRIQRIIQEDLQLSATTHGGSWRSYLDESVQLSVEGYRKSDGKVHSNSAVLTLGNGNNSMSAFYINKKFATVMGFLDGVRLKDNLHAEIIPMEDSNRRYLRNVSSTEINDHATGSVLYTTSADALRLSRYVRWHFTNLDEAYKQAVTTDSRSILVYSDLIQSSLIGNQKHQLLREIFLTQDEHDSRQLIEPHHYQWLPVRNNYVEIVEVELATLNGTLVKLPHGKSMVTVALRQRR